MRRKKKHEEHVNHERWLVSYADFITLLFAFFVTLYAISQVDAKKMGQLVESMQTAFDTKAFEAGSSKLSLSDGQSKGTDPQKLVEPISPLSPPFSSLMSIQISINNKLVRAGFVDRVRLSQERRGLVVSLSEAGFFDPGQAQLREASQIVLNAIAESLLPIANHIRIEGHTDTTPIHTADFPSNWELSTKRATYILSYLMDHFAFDPHRLSVAGYGEYRPIAPNDTAAGRAINRRVDVVILNEVEARQEPR